jgi:hypothetical protein
MAGEGSPLAEHPVAVAANQRRIDAALTYADIESW